MLGLDKEELMKDEEKIKELISHVGDHNQQEELNSELKIVKKRLKMTEES